MPTAEQREADPRATVTGVLRWKQGATVEEPDWLACEEPLEIRIKGESVAITMRTPGHDEELALGFLLSEAPPSLEARFRQVPRPLSSYSRPSVNR